LACSLAATRKTLRRYLPVTPLPKELNLPPLKKTA